MNFFTNVKGLLSRNGHGNERKILRTEFYRVLGAALFPVGL